MEYVPGGSIESLVRRFGRLHDRIVRMYTRQILVGLEYLHRHGVLHRDIKGGNILVTDRGVVKLADFGCSKRITDSDSRQYTVGTALFMSPEVIKDSRYSEQSDIWAVGCTVLEMLTGELPWTCHGASFDNPLAAMFYIANYRGAPPIPSEASAAVQDFLRQCFFLRDSATSGHPPTCTSLLQHPFLTSFDDGDIPESPQLIASLGGASELGEQAPMSPHVATMDDSNDDSGNGNTMTLTSMSCTLRSSVGGVASASPVEEPEVMAFLRTSCEDSERALRSLRSRRDAHMLSMLGSVRRSSRVPVPVTVRRTRSEPRGAASPGPRRSNSGTRVEMMTMPLHIRRMSLASNCK
eukprot:PhM_4_TR6131/c3_g1_i1/m.55767